jgi:hypothetical protein
LPAKSKAATPSSPDWLRRLRDIRGCKRELARIFGEARDRGDGWADAGKAAYILFTITRMLEGGELEERIARLETALAARNGAAPPPRHVNGNGRHAPR